jgi:2-polyprenyl-3-methyl-5-hydroxy-6-metoxy-1,4-benzoquinol methylase
MFAGHSAKFWDDRYSESGYAFGTAPNQFLTAQHQRLKPGMKTLVIGDGEGRNGVWLASQGLDVLSVDLSPVGLEKTQALAAQHQVSLQTECADLTTWNWAKATYDLVVSIYVHFAPDARQQVHRSMLNSLKPSGLIILEGFNPDQIQYQRDYNSGGPNNPAMLYDPEMLRQDFVAGEILELTETITELHEGQYHDGKASVVRLVLKK